MSQRGRLRLWGIPESIRGRKQKLRACVCVYVEKENGNIVKNDDDFDLGIVCSWILNMLDIPLIIELKHFVVFICDILWLSDI